MLSVYRNNWSGCITVNCSDSLVNRQKHWVHVWRGLTFDVSVNLVPVGLRLTCRGRHRLSSRPCTCVQRSCYINSVAAAMKSRLTRADTAAAGWRPSLHCFSYLSAPSDFKVRQQLKVKGKFCFSISYITTIRYRIFNMQGDIENVEQRWEMGSLGTAFS